MVAALLTGTSAFAGVNDPNAPLQKGPGCPTAPPVLTVAGALVAPTAPTVDPSKPPCPPRPTVTRTPTSTPPVTVPPTRTEPTRTPPTIEPTRTRPTIEPTRTRPTEPPTWTPTRTEPTRPQPPAGHNPKGDPPRNDREDRRPTHHAKVHATLVLEVVKVEHGKKVLVAHVEHARVERGQKVALLKYAGHGHWKVVATTKANKHGDFVFKGLPGKYKVVLPVHKGKDLVSNEVTIKAPRH
jgi:hypothetical protein